MKQGDPVMIETKDNYMLGFYQYKERGYIYISIDNFGNYTWGIERKDIIKMKKIKYEEV